MFPVARCGTSAAAADSRDRNKSRPKMRSAPEWREHGQKASQERQADLKRDTDKLLKLATELKQYVDKSNENVFHWMYSKKRKRSRSWRAA